ncbi:MAG: hypothetical protein U0411_06555 [Thermodesulfovibrionales bacterium]
MKEAPLAGEGSAPRSVVASILIGLFLLIAGGTALIECERFRTALDNALLSDRTAADIFAELLREHEKATIGILESYASRSAFVAAVQKKDVARARTHMADLKKKTGRWICRLSPTREAFSGQTILNFPKLSERTYRIVTGIKGPASPGALMFPRFSSSS